jgi:hypothetical protein
MVLKWFVDGIDCVVDGAWKKREKERVDQVSPV